jgi:hypothetical protein
MANRRYLVVPGLIVAMANAAYSQAPRTTPRVTYRTEVASNRASNSDGVIRYRLYRKSGEIVGLVNYREAHLAYMVLLPNGRRTTYAKSAVEYIEELGEYEIAEIQKAFRERAAAQAREKEREQQIHLFASKERADRAAAARLEAEAKLRLAEGAVSGTSLHGWPTNSDSVTSRAAQPSAMSLVASARTSFRSRAPSLETCGARTATGFCQNRVTEGGYCWLHTPTNSPTSSAPRSSSLSTGGTVQVRGYYRKDGTYVRPHTRSAPRRREVLSIVVF